jgi:hypothetical protein
MCTRSVNREPIPKIRISSLRWHFCRSLCRTLHQTVPDSTKVPTKFFFPRALWPCLSLGLLVVVALLAGDGCKPSATTPPPTPPSPPAPPATAAPLETVARIHWLGMKRLAAETNAAHFMEVWSLPESAKLENQTLDKLAAAPWRFLHGNWAETNSAMALLRPLLDDLVQEESYFEARQASNQVGEFAFALHLDDARAGLWRTNLAAVVESLTGLQSVPAQDPGNGWSLKKHVPPNLIEFTHAGNWVILGLAQERNGLSAELAARIHSAGSDNPFTGSGTNLWIEADLDLRRLVAGLGRDLGLPPQCPRIAFEAVGDGENVRTKGEFTFPQPVQLELEPWAVPTNLIHDPLIAFSAVRGLKPWLSGSKPWAGLGLGEAPGQFFAWAQGGTPFELYAAMATPEASNQVYTIRQRLLTEGNQWLTTNAPGRFEAATNSAGVLWKNLPYMEPFLRSEKCGDAEFVFGGLLPMLQAKRPAPPELLEQLFTQTNLVCYDWELTEPRIEGWLHVGQLFRLVLHKAQLAPDSASVVWLRAISPKLGNCTTVLAATGPNQLSFMRKSSAGLTSAELHLLADWLESPQFPRSLHTLMVVPQKPPQRTPNLVPTARKTNNIPGLRSAAPPGSAVKEAHP